MELKISEELVREVINYLGNHPAKDIMNIILKLNNLEPVSNEAQNPDKSA